MTTLSTRVLFWAGFLLYSLSFFLPAVVGRPLADPGAHYLPGWLVDLFFWPFIYTGVHSVDDFLKELTLGDALLVLNAWMTPIFLFVVAFLLVDKTPRLNTILRYFVLLLVPLCWIPFFHPGTYGSYYPREGYILWTVGMVLVLLSKDLGERLSRSQKV